MKLHYLVIALTFLVAFASDSLGQSKQPPSQSKPSSQPPTTDQRGTDKVPLAVKIIPAEDAEKQAEKAERERKEKAVIDEKLAYETQRIADYTDRLATFTILLFCIAILQAGLFFWQLRYMRRGMRDAEIAANAAEESAKAASKSVVLAEDTAKRQLRAYVFARNVESIWTADKATETIIKWTFFPVWKNSESTPTRRMVSNINSWVGMDAGPLPENFDFPDYGAAARNMIGPDAIMHGDRVDITVDKLQKIRDGTGHAYLWGWAEYSDIFAGTERHRSEFCFEIRVTGNPSYKEGGFGFALHGPFNGTDEDCYRQPLT